MYIQIVDISVRSVPKYTKTSGYSKEWNDLIIFKI